MTLQLASQVRTMAHFFQSRKETFTHFPGLSFKINDNWIFDKTTSAKKAYHDIGLRQE